MSTTTATVGDYRFTQAWKRLRLVILERDKWQCQIRLRGCKGRADQVDHIRPMTRGGGHHPGNLRAACKHCNITRSNKLNAQHKRRQAPPPHPMYPD